jgi:hypothetical protein
MSDKFIIIKPEEFCGMGGCLWQVIRAILHHPNQKYYIDFTDSIYKVNPDDNIWNYFFEQPHSVNYPTQDNILKGVGLINSQTTEYIWRDILPQTFEEIHNRRIMFNSIIKQYFVLNTNIKIKIDNFVKENFTNLKILGLHFRGTDHPQKKNMKDYFFEIDKVVNNYDKIFICSDENSRFEIAKSYYGAKVISYDAIRSFNDGTPLHMPWYEQRWTRNRSFEYQYKIAEDVIVESYILSNVDYLFCCGPSNVNYFSRAINPNLKAMEIYD